MSSPDVLERNEELNTQIKNFSGTYTRRKVVDTLLVIIITLGIVAIALATLFSLHLDNQIHDTDKGDIQLICADLAEEQPNNHYFVCVHIGKPALIPEKQKGGTTK